MLSFLDTHEKQIFTGNILFVVCCAFYLAWWLLAFKPTGAVTGLKTGWLLIPAAITGLLGVIWALRGVLAKPSAAQLLPGLAILAGGIALYFLLWAVTVYLLKRPATTELILIVGWGMLAVAEIDALFGYGLFSRGRSVGFIVIICAAAAVSLVCYALYYRLDMRAGYIDGMIPLLLAALTMAGISLFMAVSDRR